MTLISVFQEVSKDDFSREIKGYKPIKTNVIFLMDLLLCMVPLSPVSAQFLVAFLQFFLGELGLP